MTFKDKLMVYLYKKGNLIEEEKEELRYNRKYRPMDSLDLYENLRGEIRAEVYNELIDEIFRLLIYDYPQKKK